jgi:hypothetical protein
MRGLALFSFLLLCGCASNDRISLVADQSQQALTRDGVPALVSSKRQVVMLRPASSLVQSRGRPAFVVAVYNPTKKPIEFRAAGISAQLNHTTKGPVGLRVYSYEELVAEVERKQRWAQFGAALQGVGAAMSAANAGYTRTTGMYSGTRMGAILVLSMERTRRLPQAHFRRPHTTPVAPTLPNNMRARKLPPTLRLSKRKDDRRWMPCRIRS